MQERDQLRQALYELMLYHLDVKTGWTETKEVINARRVLGDTSREKKRIQNGYEWPWDTD
jgi:hypothetical protein